MKKYHLKHTMKKGLLIFHQGWTDIINCLTLINYYCKQYNIIYLLMRNECKELVDFYTKDIQNLKIIYINLSRISIYVQSMHFKKDKDININIKEFDILVHGAYDMCRTDKYKGQFHKGKFSFVERFYTCYDIPYITRINDFIFNRNYELENKVYNNFIKKFGTKYILYHKSTNPANPTNSEKHVVNPEVISKNYNTKCSIINLNGISTIFFDMIKVLENAIEIHLKDSVWGALIYQLDAKYRIFKNKKIVLYPERGYVKMFTEPVKLNNWIINKKI